MDLGNGFGFICFVKGFMLYHYTSLKSFKSILKNKCLWLVSSLEMSDKTDRLYGNLFGLVSLLKSDSEDAKLLRSRLEINDMLDVNVDTLNVNFYSASFCKRQTNKYLWENYASNYCGVCFEFNEDYFFERKNKLIKEKYRPLDEFDLPDDPIIIENRQVQYGNPITFFNKVLTDMKKFCICDDDIKNEGYSNNLHFKNWLELILIVFAGIIKSDSFNREEEIRLLYQDRYNDEFIREHISYSLSKYCYADILDSLGVSNKIDFPKKHIELKLDRIFDSNLISAVFVSPDFDSTCELKEALDNAGLVETKIKRIKRNEMY